MFSPSPTTTYDSTEAMIGDPGFNENDSAGHSEKVDKSNHEQEPTLDRQAENLTLDANDADKQNEQGPHPPEEKVLEMLKEKFGEGEWLLTSLPDESFGQRFDAQANDFKIIDVTTGREASAREFSNSLNYDAQMRDLAEGVLFVEGLTPEGKLSVAVHFRDTQDRIHTFTFLKESEEEPEEGKKDSSILQIDPYQEARSAPEVTTLPADDSGITFRVTPTPLPRSEARAQVSEPVRSETLATASAEKLSYDKIIQTASDKRENSLPTASEFKIPYADQAEPAGISIHQPRTTPNEPNAEPIGADTREPALLPASKEYDLLAYPKNEPIPANEAAIQVPSRAPESPPTIKTSPALIENERKANAEVEAQNLAISHIKSSSEMPLQVANLTETFTISSTVSEYAAPESINVTQIHENYIYNNPEGPKVTPFADNRESQVSDVSPKKTAREAENVIYEEFEEMILAETPLGNHFDGISELQIKNVTQEELSTLEQPAAAPDFAMFPEKIRLTERSTAKIFKKINTSADIINAAKPITARHEEKKAIETAVLEPNQAVSKGEIRQTIETPRKDRLKTEPVQRSTIIEKQLQTISSAISAKRLPVLPRLKLVEKEKAIKVTEADLKITLKNVILKQQGPAITISPITEKESAPTLVEEEAVKIVQRSSSEPIRTAQTELEIVSKPLEIPVPESTIPIEPPIAFHQPTVTENPTEHSAIPIADDIRPINASPTIGIINAQQTVNDQPKIINSYNKRVAEAAINQSAINKPEDVSHKTNANEKMNGLKTSPIGTNQQAEEQQNSTTFAQTITVQAA